MERVLRVDGSGQAESLVMLAGMYVRRRLTIQVNEVEAIVPHATRLVLG